MTKYLGYNGRNSPFSRPYRVIWNQKGLICGVYCPAFLGIDGKDKETRSSQEKPIWSNEMTHDVIDIICSDDFMKKIF